MNNNPQVLFDNLCGEIAASMVEHRVPGVSVGVLHEGEIYTRGLGVTNVEHPLLVDETTLFQIGSITKTFTATVTMQLVEKGLLDLDAPVQAYLSEFRVADEKASSQATLRHLMTHDANWVGDHFIDTGAGEDAPARYVDSMADLPQLAPFGTTYSYNNASFYLLGHILETVTGKSYGELLREHLLEPLGMDHAFLRAADVMPHRFAVGHLLDRVADIVRVATPWPLPRAVDPVGGLVTTPAELLKYARFHMGGGESAAGERLLAASAVAQMQEQQVAVWGEDEGVGLSWMLNKRSGVPIVSHTGGTTGQIALFAMIPERNFALVVLTNCYTGGQVSSDAQRWVLDNYLDCVPFEHTVIEADAKTLAAYAGLYERPFAALDLEPDATEEPRLVLTVTPQQGFPSAEIPPAPPSPSASCALCEPDRLLVLDGRSKGSTIDFIRDQAGEIRWARLSRLHRRT